MITEGVYVASIRPGRCHFQINGKIQLTFIDGRVSIAAKRPTWIREVTEAGLPIDCHPGYVCKCDPKIDDDWNAKCAQQVILDLPEWTYDHKRKVAEGRKPRVCIDPCIEHAIKKLWKQGIDTLGCCCGHNKERAWVNVGPDQYIKMFELGYEQRPVEVLNGHVMGVYTFYL